MCLDARKLNLATVKDVYPPQNIKRILAGLSKTKYLSSIDFSDAFLQVPVQESQLKTAFGISGLGYFAYKGMPFGLSNGGATLCRLVDQIFGCDLEPFVFVYLDDVTIATETLEEHLRVLKIIAERIRKAGMTINSEKSRFCMKNIKYLGYIVGEKGLIPDPVKIQQ